MNPSDKIQQQVLPARQVRQRGHRQRTPISSIVEADLRQASGELLGVVDELLIDLQSGRIEYVLATGVRGQRLQFPWSSIAVEDGQFVLRRSHPRLVAGDSLDNP